MLTAWRQAAALRIAPALVRGLAGTWRIGVQNPDPWHFVERDGGPYVLLCWHDVLLPVMWHHRHRGISALVSGARDGEYLARFAVSLGYGLIRGSSSRGGGRALRIAITALRAGTPVGITPDGPRGPGRIMKEGALAAAARGKAFVLPVHAASRPEWRAASWDRFLVPPPFARVRLAYGEPFRVAPGPDGERAGRARATNALDTATRIAEWPDGVAASTA